MNDRSKTLVRHFFSRFFDKDSLAQDADERANVVQIVAMLALPGAIVSLFTIADHPLIQSEVTRLWLRAGDRYIFVCYSMVVMGFVMTFKWDSLFPDRRDYLILTPLPISLREFFIAKLTALCAFLLLFVLAINFFSCVFIPYVYAVRDNNLAVILPGLFAHSIAVLGGSIFMAMVFAAFQGVLINLLTPAAFRRVSPWIQMISMTTLVTVLLITPGVSHNIRVLVESRTRALDYIPMFWFLGLYEAFNPEGTLIPASRLWAAKAIVATFVVAIIFALTYLISYRRHSRKILEGIESDVFREPWHQRVVAALLNCTILHHPFQRGSFYFIGRIFSRSPKHRLFIAMYGGVGIAIAISSMFVLRREVDFVLSVSLSGLREAPLILSFFVVSGLRATFNIPYELGANWMFQITSGNHAAEFLKATRRWVLLRGVLPVYVALAPLEFAFLDGYGAAFQLTFGFVIAALLTEVLFFKFNKVPFTCSYLPAKSHLAFLAGAYLYGFTMFTFTMTSLERWVQQSPERIVLFFICCGLTLVGFSWAGRDRSVQIIYEENRDPLVRQLDLG